MALQFENELPTGITANYWKVREINFDCIKKRGIIIAELYVSEELRLAGKNSVTRKMFNVKSVDGSWPFDIANLQGSNSYLEFAYNYLKTLPEFSGAVDLI